MASLPDRLRAAARAEAKRADYFVRQRLVPPCAASDPHALVAWEAAEEIERLQREVEALRATIAGAPGQTEPPGCPIPGACACPGVAQTADLAE